MSRKLWVRTESNHYNSLADATVFWTIDDFMGRGCEENDKSILSPTFRVRHANFEKTKWQIQVFPRGDIAFMDGQGLPPSDATGHVSVFLRGTSDIKKDHVQVYVSIVDFHHNRVAEKKLQYQANTQKISDDENICFGESEFFSRRDLWVYEEENLPGDSLTLAFKIDIDGDAEDEPVEVVQNESIDSQAKSINRVIEHFGNLLENKEFCDMEIVCGGKVFPCHKLIVSTRSPVFRAMFETKMRESELGKVTIEDIKPEVMTDMLYFIYTGLVKETVTTEFAIELLAAADKYQLDSLKDICQDKIRSVLHDENAIEFLIIGEMYQAPKLRESALMEVAHNMPEIADTVDYQRLVDHPQLALEIPKAIFK